MVDMPPPTKRRLEPTREVWEGGLGFRVQAAPPPTFRGFQFFEAVGWSFKGPSSQKYYRTHRHNHLYVH